MQRQYVVSERAHFMCPNMHFGMIAEIEKACVPEDIASTLHRLAQAHPFLRSVIAACEDDDRLYYKVTDRSQIALSIRDDDSALWDDYKAAAVQDWNVFDEGLLRVIVYPKKSGMTVLFIAHHLLVDGRGLLGVAQEFADDYVKGIAPAYAEENLIAGIDDLPDKSRLSGISRLLVRQANRQWAKEKQTVSYAQYIAFAREYARTHPVDYQVYDIHEDAMADMVQLCRANGFTVNDLLMAHMYLKTGAEKIIIAADIRNQFPNYREGALGNYSTALSIRFRPSSPDLVETGKKVHQRVRRRLSNNRALMLILACYFEMTPTLLDAAAISALGGFASSAGLFVGDRMFGFRHPRSYSITNLGRIESDSIRSLVFIPPASPAAKLSLGVVTLNGRLRACSSRNR